MFTVGTLRQAVKQPLVSIPNYKHLIVELFLSGKIKKLGTYRFTYVSNCFHGHCCMVINVFMVVPIRMALAYRINLFKSLLERAR